MKTKLCKGCGKRKSIIKFNKYNRSPDRLQYYCKDCQSKNAKDNVLRRSLKKKERILKNPIKEWAQQTIYSHRKMGLNVNITVDEVLSLAQSHSNCNICDKELDYSLYTKGHIMHNSPTVDRINNTNDFNITNIQILCNDCNRIKHNKPMPEFVKYCEMVYKKFGGNNGKQSA